MNDKPVVGIIMGSDSDLEVMSEAAKTLEKFGVPHEVRVVSAHRSPEHMQEYAASAKDRDLKIIIAGAGGSAHLPGMTASHTSLPVIAVPIRKKEQGHEAFWSSIKMPPGVPLATMPENGAKNAALLAVEILSLNDLRLAQEYDEFKKEQTDSVIEIDKNMQESGWQNILEDD